jgi:hypothetical protein
MLRQGNELDSMKLKGQNGVCHELGLILRLILPLPNLQEVHQIAYLLSGVRKRKKALEKI